MKRLIINPKKKLLDGNDENIFLQNSFLNYLNENQKQKINYNTLPKKKLDINSEIKEIKRNREVCEEILRELFPILNKLNKINWDYKTWNFFIGQWLNFYVSVIRNRIDLIKPVINSDIKISIMDLNLNLTS